MGCTDPLITLEGGSAQAHPASVLEFTQNEVDESSMSRTFQDLACLQQPKWTGRSSLGWQAFPCRQCMPLQVRHRRQKGFAC